MKTFFYTVLMVVPMFALMSCVGEDLSELKVKNMGNETPDEPISSIQAVDLGLSVKWANMNLGATSDKDLGDGYYLHDTNRNYPSKIDISGVSQYDPASRQLGGIWRLPTKDEIIELRDNCTLQYKMINGTGGCEVIGPNGNSIFFPLDMNSLSQNTFRYWTGSSAGNSNNYYYYWDVNINQSSCSIDFYYINIYAMTYYIRPVQDK